MTNELAAQLARFMDAPDAKTLTIVKDGDQLLLNTWTVDLRAKQFADSTGDTPTDGVREALADIAWQARTRIKDGDEMGARVWRIALVDILKEADAALSPVCGDGG